MSQSKLAKAFEIFLVYFLAAVSNIADALKLISSGIKNLTVLIYKYVRSTVIEKMRSSEGGLSAIICKLSALKENGERYSKIRTAIITSFVALIISVIGIGAISSYTPCIKLDYGDKGIFYVADSLSAANVEANIRASLLGCEMEDVLKAPVVTVCYEPKNKLELEKNVSDIICAQLTGLEYSCGMYVNGSLVAVANEKEEFETNVAAIMKVINVSDGTVVGVNEDVTYTYGYAPKEQILTAEGVKEKFDSKEIVLSPVMLVTQTFSKEVSFQTNITYDSKKLKGYSSTVKKGQNGLENVTVSVAYVDGQEISSELIYSETVSEPVDAEVVKGTATVKSVYTPVDFSGVRYSEDAQFVWPTARTSRTYISSYWGDGRGHKGMDIASPKGTDIYAVADGVVTVSTTDSNYGKYIIIDHGEGLKTLYSHCNSLNVKEGETVKEGQKIATVGISGNATGYHLHFEVHKNGKKVDPSIYLGVN